MPVAYFASGATYVLALYAALARAGLPNGSYEFNAAVVRVLDTPDAEKRWLAGEDIFAGVLAETVGYYQGFGGISSVTRGTCESPTKKSPLEFRPM